MLPSSSPAFATTALWGCGALFGAMLLALELGRRLGVRQLERDPAAAESGLGSVEGAAFGLMGLLVAFTFSSAAARFDARRKLIVEETNAIGTAYLRVDLLPTDVQPALRESFRAYLEARIAIYRVPADLEVLSAQLTQSSELQGAIWRQAVEGCNRPTVAPSVCVLVVPALNAMIDITTTRAYALRMHLPAIIFVLLFALAVVCSVLAGYAMATGQRRRWLHILGFTVITVITVYVIFDLEFPRFGLIRVESFDQALVDLRATMK